MTMQTDELRAELTDLANEVEPFEGDVSAVRRRVARRRLAVGSIGAVAAIALVVVLASVGMSRSNQVDVASSVKNVSAAQLQHFDAAVVLPAGATGEDASRVQRVLNSSDAVVQYTPLSANELALAFSNDPLAKSVKARACADPSTRSFAVALARTDPDAQRQLTTAVGAAATVQPRGRADDDVEIFMQVKASDRQIQKVRDQIATDPDILKYRFLNHNDAYNEFKRLFSEQPALIQHETPAGLPTSFRLTIRDAVSGSRVANRYQHVPGVDMDTVYTYPLAHEPFSSDTQACTKTP
jgi:hypothetical protein